MGSIIWHKGSLRQSPHDTAAISLSQLRPLLDLLTPVVNNHGCSDYSVVVPAHM